MIETINIFIITIINKILLIWFIFNWLKDFAVEIKNYKLNYLQNDWKNEDFISITQTVFGLNNLIQLVDNFVISNKERNLVNRFEKNSIFEFNLSY